MHNSIKQKINACNHQVLDPNRSLRVKTGKGTIINQQLNRSVCTNRTQNQGAYLSGMIRQCYYKFTALARFADEPDFAAMPFNKFLAEQQPQTCSLFLIGTGS